MDLNALKPVKADKGATLNILHPETEEPIEGMTITLLGRDSAVYTQMQISKQQVVLNRMVKGKKAAELDAEKLAEDAIDDLVKLTVKWTGFQINGEELAATPENFRMVYTEWLWIREQAQEFVNNRANFFR